MIASGADLFNVDHMVDFQNARNTYSEAGKCFKGNLNPVGDMLNVTPEHCLNKALECLGMADGTKYMLSAGCEIPAGVSDETFEAFCSASKLFAEIRKEKF
jgi:uroporphyrinogen-III decarboxylase